MIKMARVPIVSVLLLTCFVLRCHSLICPPSCSCRGTSVLNCSLAGLWTMPQIPDSVAHLDVSHNGLERLALLRRTLPRLRSLSLANNSIARLSLCIHGRVQGQGCASWAPNLHLLSVERNQLRRLPRGLSALETLEILRLSFNSITTIQLGELDNLRGLRELHLQHNLISSLHSDAFRHLQQLKILNVSFNMLTSLNPSIYISLHTIGADVHLAGNRWHCDCNMCSVRRWMALDRSRGSRSWDLVCASPPILAGADVLEVEDDDLNCWSAEKEPKLHQDVTVHRDSQVLLSCATKGGLWRTPAGLVPANQPQSGLLVSAITEKNTGLYVCLSEDYQVVSVFHLHIAGTSRKARSVTERIAGGERSQTVTQSNLTLAVCLSVFITFLVAFILGVLLRPYIDMLWKRITRKKTSNPVSSAEERQYDNEAYSAGEDPEELRPHRERRVTFSTVDFREENNVKYHNKERESKANSTVVECEMVTDGDSGSEKSLERRDSLDTRGLSDQNLKRRGSLSDSSLSDKDQKEVDTVQQNSTELPPISRNKIPGFAFEPILHPNNGRILAEEPEDDEEQFEFSDRSTSPRTSSPVGSYNYSRQIMPRLNRKDSSNSSSYMSDDEPSEYTVNPDLQEEEDMRRRYAKSGHEPSLDQDTELWWPAVDLEDSMRVQRRLDIKVCEDDRQTTSFSKKPGTEMVVTAGVAPSIYLSSSDSEETRRRVTVPPRLDSQTQRPALDLEHTIAVQRYSDIKAPLQRSDSSSGTDSEDGSIHLTEAPQRFDRAGLLEQEVRLGKDTRWPAIDLQQIPRIERHLNVKSTLADSSSSSDSEDVRRTTILQPPSKVSPSYDAQATRPSVDLEDSFRTKRLDVKATSPTLDASSDSDSDEVVSNYITKPEEETRTVTRYPIKAPPTPNYDPQSPWPSIDLEESFRIKRRLNVKVLSPPSDSSSSRNRDYGTTHDITKQEQELAKVTKSSTKASSTPSYYPHGRWPKIDLEDSFRIKRRLNVKGPPAPSGSLSSSNSEHETIHYITKHEQRPTPVTRYSLKESPTQNYDPHAPWPTLNLADSFQIKRRLDVKARSTTLDASSDSDNDEVVTNYIIKPEQEIRNVTRYPIKAPPTPNYDPQSPWPSIDLEESFRIKRRLNVKVLSPPSDSSSSRNRDYGTTHDITKHEQELAKVTKSSTKASLTPSYYPHGRWPKIDLEDSFRIKRRLNVKGPPSPSDSMSNSNSEHETIHHITKHEQRPTPVTRYSLKESPTRNYDPHAPWPTLNLADSFQIKRRLDVKARSTTLDASSDSDNDEVVTNYIIKLEQETRNVTRYPIKAPPTPNYDPQSPWPSIDLEESFRIKRRLNVKVLSPPSDSSSSRNRDYGTTHDITKQEQELAKVTKSSTKASLTPSYYPHGRWPKIDLEDSFRIKRRLNVKGPPSPSDSLSSSNSEHKTIHHITKHEQRPTPVTRYSLKESPTRNYDPHAPWPTLNLADSFQIKRRLDVKARSTTLDASSDSDSSEVVTNYIIKPEQETRKVTRYPIKAPPTPNYDTQSPWPSIDLEDSFRIKKRLNVKVLSPRSDSSSSRYRGHGTTHDITKQEQGVAKLTRSSTKASSTPNYYPHGRWPTIDLEDSFRIKRRLDVKGPPTPSDSSPSSDSEHETIQHITKHQQRPTHVTRYSSKESPMPNYDPHATWPTLNLEDSFRIKRRLDVQITLPTLDASSDSESDDEVSNYITKPDEETRKVTRYPMKAPPTRNYDTQSPWPSIDLEDSFRIKRRLNVKEPSPLSDSLSSSNSEHETIQHITKQEQRPTHVNRYSSKESPTRNYDPHAPWPTLNLKESFQIKRRLDVKARSTTLDASSDSDNDEVVTNYIIKPEQETRNVTRYPIKVPPTPIYDPQSPWPSIDLEDSFRIKRRLNVKVLSPPSDSSSSRNRDHGTTHDITKQEQGLAKITRSSTIASSTPSYYPHGRWPTIDLEDSFRIKRCLNVKGPPTPSDSSPSSDSEHETIQHITKHEQIPTQVTRYFSKGSPKLNYDPHSPWPTLNLADSFRIKRRLDVKATSTTLDASSDSESDDEVTNYITKPEQDNRKVTRYPIKAPSTSYDPQATWPMVDLDGTFRIKRRLHVKQLSATPDSSSSSNSKNEMTFHPTKQKQGVTNTIRYPMKPSYDPEVPWPSLDFKDSFRIKRRLDFKAPLPTSYLTSSSESEDETMYYTQNQGQGTTKITSYVPKAPSYGPQSTWPTLDLENSFRIKRRLDINVTSPHSDSLSSSDHEYDITHHIIKQNFGTQKTHHPINVSPRINSDSQSSWPSLDLEDSFRIKRRLNFQVLSPTSDLSSITMKQEQGTANLARYATAELTKPRHEPQGLWSLLDLEDSFRIKRRLEIKAPSPASTYSSNSEEDTSVDGQRQGYYETQKGRSSTEPSNRHLLETEHPTLDFHTVKHLDFEAPSPTSATIGNEINQYPGSLHHGLDGDSDSKTTVFRGTSVTLHTTSQDQETNLGRNLRLKRRLDIKALLPPPVRISSSDTMVASNHVESPGVTPWPSVDLGRDTRVRWRLDIKAAPADVSHGVNQPSSSNEQDDTNADATETQALPRVYLGVSRRLDIKASSPQQQLAADRISPEACYSKSNCSTNDSDEENQDEKSSLKVADKSSIKSPAIIVPRSPKKDSNIKLEKYVIVPETTGDKLSIATPEINSELQSRWANMHLGFSRFRKRLEITSHACEPPVVPLSESDPEQTKQKHTVLGWQGNRHTESPLTAAQDHDNPDQPAVGPTSEGKSSVTGLPRIRRYLDVKAPPTLKQGLDSSSSSENEAESTEYSQWRAKPHDLRLSSSYATRTVETQQTAEKSQVATVPRQTSSNNSEDETGEVAEASEMTEVPRSVTPHSDSPIPYRRLIIKPSSLPNDTSTRDQHTDGMTTLHGSSYSTRYQLPSLAPKTIPNPRSGDYMSSTREIYSYSYSARPYTARNQTLYIAPKTIPSLGSGDDTPLTRDSSDVNIRTAQSGSSYSGRYQIPSLAPRPFRNSTEGPPAAIRWTGLRTSLSDPSKHPDSSLPSPLGGLPKTQTGSLTMEVAQENRSTTVTRSLHLGSNSLSSFGTDEMWNGASEKTERKGLSALKAMSESRQTWDKDEKVRHFQPSGNSGNSNQNRSQDLVSYTSPSIGEDLPYDILRYRTHALTQEIPPPVPTTPLPDEAVELTRNSKSSYTPSISQV